MPVVSISLIENVLRDMQGQPAWPSVSSALATLARGAPVIILLHGFKYAPGDAAHCPHDHILSPTPSGANKRSVSWPRHLGYGRGDPKEGLCIAVGWPARGSFRTARRRAAETGERLAELISMISATHGPSHLLAHSLGAEVALTALGRAGPDSVGRIVLMAAAARQSSAQSALDSPAGKSAEVVNVTSRENRLFDLMYRVASLAPGRSGRTLGAGLGAARTGWVDLAIDAPLTRAHMAELGHRIPAPTRRVCHWWGYLRPGLFGLYRALLRGDGALTLADLRPPAPHMTLPRPLPLRRKWPC